jgi:hypothetical protein
MIIIPEIETVVILVPRTGTGSLRRAIAARYPTSMLLYRHMEADGIPAGYDRWRKVGLVREPASRLWSLYKFLKTYGDTEHQRRHDTAYIAAMRAQVDRPFDDWIINNRVVFTGPYDSAGRGRYFPHYTVRHHLPENLKSQFLYLRPDLGTEIYQYASHSRLWETLGLTSNFTHNVTDAQRRPDLSAAAIDHIVRFFAWDVEAARGNIDRIAA